MKNIFDSYFENHFKELNVLSEKGFEKSAKYYRSFLKNVLPKHKGVKILDVGCGLGHFLYFLEKQGYTDYFGIDISEQQIKFCREKVNEKAQAADAFEFLKVKKNSFDVIVLNDVLEHITKNRTMEMLGLVYNSLRDKGTLIVKVPNASNPFGLMDRYMDFTHELGFTEFSLKEVLKMAGFEKVIIKGAGYPVISIKTLLGKIVATPFYWFLRIMFLIQGHSVPKFMDKDIMGIGTKKGNMSADLMKDYDQEDPKECEETYKRKKREIYIEKHWTPQIEGMVQRYCQGKHVLDLGCGYGRYMDSIKKHVNKVVGLDISKRWLDRAKEKYPDIEFVLGDAHKIPFGDSAFDGVVTLGLFEYIKRDVVVKEISRVLRNQGFCIIFVTNKWSLNNIVYRLWYKILRKEPRQYPPSRKEMISLFEKNGFQLREQEMNDGLIWLPGFLDNLIGDKMYLLISKFFGLFGRNPFSNGFLFAFQKNT